MKTGNRVEQCDYRLVIEIIIYIVADISVFIIVTA